MLEEHTQDEPLFDSWDIRLTEFYLHAQAATETEKTHMKHIKPHQLMAVPETVQ